MGVKTAIAVLNQREFGIRILAVETAAIETTRPVPVPSDP